MFYQYSYNFISLIFEIYQLNRNRSKSFVFYCAIIPVYESPSHGVWGCFQFFTSTKAAA